MITTFVEKFENAEIHHLDLLKHLKDVNDLTEDRYRIHGFFYREQWWRKGEWRYELLYDCYRENRKHFGDNLLEAARAILGGEEVEVLIGNGTPQDIRMFLYGIRSQIINEKRIVSDGRGA